MLESALQSLGDSIIKFRIMYEKAEGLPGGIKAIWIMHTNIFEFSSSILWFGFYIPYFGYA